MSIAGEIVHYWQDESCAFKVAHLVIRGRPEFVGFQRFPSRMTPRIQGDHELRIRLNVPVLSEKIEHDLGLAVRVDCRRSVAEPQWEPRSVSAAVTSRPMVKQLARPRPCRTAHIAITLAPVLAAMLGATVNPAWGCRYSVRDVAFVNVHGAPWQLHLVPPPSSIDDASELPGQPAQWRQVVAERLADSNIQHTWFDATTPEGSNVLSLFDQVHPAKPCMALVNGEGMVTRLDLLPDGLAATIDALVDSPVRSQILDAVAAALCAIVVVENKDPERVAEIQEIVQVAARQVHDQMWMLEKPTRHGPVVINVPYDKQTQEKWLLKSLGIDDLHDRPAVAIVFGQGRRLGPVLYDEEIQTATIVARASLCGRDCECDLDRRWLYRSQIIHRWPDERQRMAEENLDFDPYSALVLAEVNQIIQTNRQVGSGKVVDLGPGLRIHDLAQVEATASEGHRTEVTALEGHRTEVTGSEGHRTEVMGLEGHRTEVTASEGHRTEVTASEGHRTEVTALEGHRTEATGSEGHRTKSAVPWRIMSILVGLVVIVTALTWFRATRQSAKP